MSLRSGIAAGLFCAVLYAAQVESPQQLVERLTPEQKQQFDTASQAFASQRYPQALAAFKQLLQQVPGDPVLSKFAGEAALDSGDAKFALDTVKPVAEGNSDDWQATALLARACAELGDKNARDAAMAHMLELRQKGLTPAGMQAYLLERVKLDDKTLMIRRSVVPWGPYNVYYLGQLINAQGQIFFRMTLESSDGDQSFFAQEHPKEAAAGIRLFSIDGYAQTGVDSTGRMTQKHITFGFYTGEPSYDTVREKFLAIAEGKATAISSRTGLRAP